MNYKKAKVLYLKWDRPNGDRLRMGLLTGEIYSEEDYELQDEFYILRGDLWENLEKIYEAYNRIDDRPCRLNESQRSMCVGDLIIYDNTCYVVKPVGFDVVDLFKS